jgi:hypothetical protein
MENITAKIKLILGSSLKPEELTKLKADILKLEANLTPAPVVPTPAPVTLGESKTKDGKILSYDGELKETTMVNVMDEATGLPIPAPTGDYELEDGTIVTITDGVVTAIKKVEAPAAPAPPSIEEMQTQLSAHKKEIETAYEAKLSAQNKELNNKIDELSKIVLSQMKMVDTFINTPIETVNLADNKPKTELSEAEYNALTNFQKVQYNRRNK